MCTPSIQVEVVYLGGSRAQAGCTREPLRLPEGATLGDAARAVACRHPKLAPLMACVRWARNLELGELDTPLQEGDEVALLPPVAGGAPRARLTHAPISIDRAFGEVRRHACGATVLFVGTVRDHNSGHTVTGLDYEAYGPMAERQLNAICDALSHEHSEVAITHRLGALAVGDISIVIAAAAPHRDAAFTACRAALEAVKKDAAIWKHEHRAEGDSWLGWGGG